MLAELAAANAAFGVIKSFISNGKELASCLKQIMIYAGRPGLWQDWQRFQAEARKSRRYAEKMARKRKEELLEIMGYSIAFIALLGLGGLILYFVGKWTGKL